MAKLILRKRAEEPNPAAGKSCNWEFEDFNKRAEKMPEHELRAEWMDRIKGKGVGDAPIWLVKMGLQYHYLVKGQVRVAGNASPKVMHRYKLCKNFDKAGLKKESDFLVGAYETGGNDMKGKVTEQRKGERRSGKLTAGRVLIGILGQDKVPADADIIKQVREATGSDKFDERQLSWYKWKYRQGRLKGQDGKAHVIAQGSPLKEKAPKKKSIIVKKKKKK